MQEASDPSVVLLFSKSTILQNDRAGPGSSFKGVQKYEVFELYSSITLGHPLTLSTLITFIGGANNSQSEPFLALFIMIATFL